MTCIVGYVDKDTNSVVVGADSAGVSGLDISVRKDTKVFKVGEFIIGCTSSFRMIQLLRFSFTPPNPESFKKDIYEFMCVDFINAVRECFKNGGYLQKYTEGDEKGGTFLVGYKNRLFGIGDDFQVAENLNGIDACGCGQSYALGSLHAVSDSAMTPEEKVITALKTAEFYSAGVSGPFNVLNTRSSEALYIK